MSCSGCNNGTGGVLTRTSINGQTVLAVNGVPVSVNGTGLPNFTSLNGVQFVTTANGQQVAVSSANGQPFITQALTSATNAKAQACNGNCTSGVSCPCGNTSGSATTLNQPSLSVNGCSALNNGALFPGSTVTNICRGYSSTVVGNPCAEARGPCGERLAVGENGSGVVLTSQNGGVGVVQTGLGGGVVAVRSTLPPWQQKRKCQKQTLGYTLPPPRADFYPQKPRPYELAFLTGFENFDVGLCESNMWNYLTDGDTFVANDGAIRITNRGLSWNASKYTLTVPAPNATNNKSPTVDASGLLDNFKGLSILNSQFATPRCGQIRIEGCMSAQINGADNVNISQTSGGPGYPKTLQVVSGGQVSSLPVFTNPQSDPRIAASVLWMMSGDLGFAHGFHLTNQGLFAGYHALPFGSQELFGGPETTPAVFSSVRQVGGQRNGHHPLQDSLRLAVAYDCNENSAVAYVNDQEVWRHNRFGTRPTSADIIKELGGEAKEQRPSCMTVAFGHVNMMDAVDPAISDQTTQTVVYPYFAAGPNGNLGNGYAYRSMFTSALNAPNTSTILGLQDVAEVLTVYPNTLGLGQDRGVAAPNQRIFGQGSTLAITELKVVYAG